MKSIKIDSSDCLPPCSGLIISSFTKTDGTKNLESLIDDKFAAYRKFTKWFKFPSGIKGVSIPYQYINTLLSHCRL